MKFSVCVVSVLATTVYGFAPNAFIGKSLNVKYGQTTTSRLEMALKPGESKFELSFRVR
jgi:hypothetical protein